MAQSIAYDPRTSTKKGFFSGPVLAPRGGPEVQIPLYFIEKIILFVFKKGKESDVGPEEGMGSPGG
jgi:hypothetical protein